VDALTHDTFFDGQIRIRQPASGYRFSVDAVILVHLARPASPATLVDLGTGCGVIPIMLAHRHPRIKLIGVEIQPDLAALARQNVQDNGMADRVRIIEKDMRQLTVTDLGGPVDGVVTNPPYRKQNSGRMNVSRQRSIARHEVAIDLLGVLQTARRVLRKGGRLTLIYPCVRAVDLMTAMRAAGLEPKILTMIHGRPATPARLVAVSATKDGGHGLAVTPPLYLYTPDGSYSREAEAMWRASPPS
jgi:tRNA1Val (adenine37-N6)-methyltransferase